MGEIFDFLNEQYIDIDTRKPVKDPGHINPPPLEVEFKNHSAPIHTTPQEEEITEYYY